MPDIDVTAININPIAESANELNSLNTR